MKYIGIKGYRENDYSLWCKYFIGSAATIKGLRRKINFLAANGYGCIQITANRQISYIRWKGLRWERDDNLMVSARFLKTLTPVNKHWQETSND
jgi:hypothetical protein